MLLMMLPLWGQVKRLLGIPSLLAEQWRPTCTPGSRAPVPSAGSPLTVEAVQVISWGSCGHFVSTAHSSSSSCGTGDVLWLVFRL